MNELQQKLQSAMAYAMKNRPKVGGFPFLAECLRKAGVEKNIWSLPSAQSIYITKEGSLVKPGVALASEMTPVPDFDKEALIKALRTDQAGESTFLEFILSAWNAGVVSYEVDFIERTVSYRGALGEEYVESYPKVEVGGDDDLDILMFV
jgi:uncharacterized protein YbcV (DUF1398 family)